MSVSDKNNSSVDSKDVPELNETKLWTPNYILERSEGLSNARECSGPPFYGTVKTPNVNDKDSLITPDDFRRKPTSKSEKLPRGRNTTEPPIYLTL